MSARNLSASTFLDVVDTEISVAMRRVLSLRCGFSSHYSGNRTALVASVIASAINWHIREHGLNAAERLLANLLEDFRRHRVSRQTEACDQ